MEFIVVYADKDHTIVGEKIPQQRESRIHHAEPFVVPRQIFGFRPHDLAQPALHLRAIYGVVVNPFFVASVVRRVYIDALHFTGVIRQESFEGQQVVALDQKITAVGVPGGKTRITFQQSVRHLPVVIYNRLFPDPIKRGHTLILVAKCFFRERIMVQPCQIVKLGVGLFMLCAFFS